MPSGEIATPVTVPPWPVRKIRDWPVAGYQICVSGRRVAMGKPGVVGRDGHGGHGVGVAGQDGPLLTRGWVP